MCALAQILFEFQALALRIMIERGVHPVHRRVWRCILRRLPSQPQLFFLLLRCCADCKLAPAREKYAIGGWIRFPGSDPQAGSESASLSKWQPTLETYLSVEVGGRHDPQFISN